MDATLAPPHPSSPARTQILDLLGFINLVLTFIAYPSKFEQEYWWIGPLVVIAWGWSLWRRKSFWGKFVIAFGFWLLIRGHQKQMRKIAAERSLASQPMEKQNVLAANAGGVSSARIV